MFSDKRLLDKIEDYRICCLTIWTDDISILGLEALYQNIYRPYCFVRGSKNIIINIADSQFIRKEIIDLRKDNDYIR